MMNKPIDVCANISGHIIANIKTIFPKIRFWHVVEETSSLSASLRLYIAGEQPPAFTYVSITCNISPHSFAMREVSVRTYSDEWNEHTLPGVILVEREIPRMLEEEEKKLGYAPRFALTTGYPSVTGEKSAKTLKITFNEILLEFDAAGEEKPDYESVATDIVQQIKTVHKVWEKIRELSYLE